MERRWWGKLILLLVFVVTSVIYVYPTISNLDLEKTSFPYKKKVNLGLDLQGGLYMVFGVEFKKVYDEILARQLQSLKSTVESKQGSLRSKLVGEDSAENDPRAEILFDVKNRDLIHRSIKDTYTTLRIVEEFPGRMLLGLNRAYREDVQANTLGQSIEVIRNRIDEFGVTEPAISSQGTSRIIVELPGVREIERAKQLVGRTAKLEFKIVNDKAMNYEKLSQLIAQIEKEHGIKFKEGGRFSDYVNQLNQFAKGKLPEGSQISFERQAARGGNPESSGNWIPYLLFSKVDVTGADLKDAQVSFDQENRSPIVTFELTPKGATTFEKLTGDHRGERLAIVLDNIVHSAPVIQNQIGGGHGQITLGRGRAGGEDSLMKEAKDLAIVLRAGALPAQLELLEQRVIGPTLGQDSIKKGVTAGIVGCLLTFGFMIFYYRLSGVVAVISLILNGLFAFAILIGIDATLTLPGIAGLALVIGMAVDSNVIIFERIRDEIDDGKSPTHAIESGFDKAFSSIFDANITHGIVGLILLNFGTGPIKGFAVSLLIGIVTTLFSAVTVCKMIFDGYVAKKAGKITRLSI